MSLFSQTVEAYLDNRTIEASLLVFMDFTDNPKRWWTGFGTLMAGGYEWEGAGDIVQIDGLSQGQAGEATETTFTLSGVNPEIVAMVRSGSAAVKDRRVIVYIQFFHIEDSGGQVHSTLDGPVAIWAGRMDLLRYAADGPSSRTVILTAENIWSSRRRPPFGLYTDQDQKARFPGDRGLEQVPDLVTKTIDWPTF